MQSSNVSFHQSHSYEEALRRAGDFHGVEAAYHDIWGREHLTPPEVDRAILGALGVDTSSRESLDGAAEAFLEREWSALLPPVLVLVERGGAIHLPVRYAVGSAPGPCEAVVELEDGGEFREEIEPAAGAVSRTAEIRGREYVEVECRLRSPIPLGYHQVTLEARDGEKASTRLIVCPHTAYRPPAMKDGGRLAGIAIHLPGLRSKRNWGCGDFTDLEALAEWAVDSAGLAYIALNPLHALHNRQPFNTSPYLPNSVFFRNILYLDVERVEEVQCEGRAHRLLHSPAVRREIVALRASPFVEYERVQALKLRVLYPAFVSFLASHWKTGNGRSEEFAAYVESEGELLDRFAVFCALDSWIHRRHPDGWVWTDWPEQFQHPESARVKEFAERHWKFVLFFKWLQWQAEGQLARAQAYALKKGMPIGLYHDLALATDRYGADLWGHREFFVTGCRVGAPPDGFSPSGQDWAFPPPNAQAHRDAAYRLFVHSIRNNCRHGGALRMDHVMRFFRLYWIPDGMTAKDGAYVRERYDDHLRILALESVRNRVVLIGEDLGTVSPNVREALHRYGVLSYKLLYFERHGDGSFRRPEEYPELALCATTTHDLPTLAGFWTGQDIQARVEAGVFAEPHMEHEARRSRAEEKQRLLDAFHAAHLLPGDFPRNAVDVPELVPELHYAAVGYLASTPSTLFLMNQEDLTKELEQQNLPGTTWQHPNWSRKTRFLLEELAEDPLVSGCTRMLADWLRRTGRIWPRT